MRKNTLAVCALNAIFGAPLATAGDWGANWGRMYWGNDPVSAPAAPLITSIAPGFGELIVNFSPGSDGFSVITGYMVVCGEESAQSAGSPITVQGLDGGGEYECTVTATNDFGTSSDSAVVAASPLIAGSSLKTILYKAIIDNAAPP